MKTLLYIVAFFCLSVQSLLAQTVSEKAEKAYTEDKYQEAVTLYEQLIKEGQVSSDLYYNLGNSYFKSGNLGKSVLSYERALLLDPNNAEAETNLAFVNSKIKDKMSNGENMMNTLYASILHSFSYNGWATLGIISFLLILVCAALYIFNEGVLIRKIGFFGGMSMILICLLANVFAFKSSKALTDSDKAVIIDYSVVLSLSPREPKSKSEEAFILNEGAKVEIIDSVEVKEGEIKQVWYNVQADDAHKAWIDSKHVEKI